MGASVSLCLLQSAKTARNGGYYTGNLLRALSHMHKSHVKIVRYISFLKVISLNILRDRWRKSMAAWNKHCF